MAGSIESISRNLSRQERSREPLQSAPLVETQQTEDKAQPPRIGQQARENEIQYRARERRAWRAKLLARGFGDAPILHAGRTRGLAGAAEQAEIDVFFETIVKLDASFGGGFDQMNSPARRLRLEVQRAIGRTLIQTKAAMHALVELGEIQCGHLRSGGVVGFVVQQFQSRPFVSLESRV